MAYINLKSKYKPETYTSSNFNVVGISEDYSAISEDDYIGVVSEAPVTITLPEGMSGKCITVKNEWGEDSGVITVMGSNEELIDREPSFELTEPFESVSFIFRSGSWHAI